MAGFSALYGALILFLAVLASLYFIKDLKKRISKAGIWTPGQEDPELSEEAYAKAAANVPPKRPGEKRIVWVMHSYVPNVLAGSEITAEDQIAFLKKKGWTVYVLVNRWVVPEHKGVQIFPIKKDRLGEAPDGIRKLFQSADLIAAQNYPINDLFLAVDEFKKPVVIFLHTQNDNRSTLSFRMGSPTYVVYNVNFIKLESTNAHPSIVVHPKVDTEKFKFEKHDPKYVTLINCNENKGGPLLPQIAKALPEIQFLGIKGSYAKQNVQDDKPANLTYLDTQTDMVSIYKKTKVLIMPSKSETWGRTAVEAMASGTPVIVSRSPGLLECVGKAENSCDRNDLSCWIEKVETLMTDDKAYHQASVLSKERIMELDSEDEYERLDVFLLDVAKRHAEGADADAETN
jgi:glycosyltransferase involved in cell wall biosynthesis